MAKKRTAARKDDTSSFFDLRKIGVILAIAILFTIFVFALIEAVYPNPSYSDYCDQPSVERPLYKESQECAAVQEPSQQEIQACADQGGMISYDRDAYNCPTDWRCEMCQKNYDDAREQHEFISFIISSIFALVAIVIGLLLPAGKRQLNHWVGTGFMLGGLITLFVGTAMVYGDLHRYLKPIVIFIELVIVLFLAYKKFGDK